ncbi:hypothetical protein I3843_11G029200 [Carya illinoinensis]|nr:hypothetical protein I3843_11G029200 [Carya illinoinensis]
MALGPSCRHLCNQLKVKDGEMFGVKLRRRRRRRRRRQGEVGKKVQKLQRIVPGGHVLQADNLLLQTANYILNLRLQVHVLKSVLSLHEQ